MEIENIGGGTDQMPHEQHNLSKDSPLDSDESSKQRMQIAQAASSIMAASQSITSVRPV